MADPIVDHPIVQRLLVRRWYAVATFAWVVRYLTLGHIPVLQRPIWADWFDQSRYLASALAFAHGNLAAAAHWYPLGYPLIAAPFAWVMPSDPFVVPDLLLFLVTCAGFQRAVATVGIGRAGATMAFVVAAIVQKDVAAAWVHPWTSTLSAALIWWLLAGTAATFERNGRGLTLRGAVLLGVLAGALPLVRPVDALIGATCLIAAAVALTIARRMAIATVLAVLAGGMGVCIGYGLLHLTIYGPHPTAYMVAAAQTGFVPSDIGWKAYVLLVDPRPWFPNNTSIVETLPWIVPGIAGLIALGIVARGAVRWVLILFAAVILPSTLLMLTYADLQPPGLWTFGNIHYFKWMMPLFGAGVVLWFRLLTTAQGRVALATAMLALILPLGIRIDPVAVAGDVPARMLRFRGDPHRDWQEGYFAPVTVSDAIGTQANVRDFHQIPDADGQRAIAVRRLFASDPRRSDPGEPPGGVTGQRPYARYGERITFGLPD